MLIGLIINSDGSSTATKTSTTLSDNFSVSSESVELPLSGNSDEPVATVAETIAPSVVRIDTATGTGSGIIYDKNGSVVTNAHVVLGSDTVEIQLADGTRATGKVLGSDPAVDIAIVQIVEDLDFRKATFATLDTVRVGQLAVAIGSPFGLEQSVTAGIVSAVNRAVPTLNVENGSRTVLEMIQTDAPINPGNSGGALVDRQGRVVGMNTLIRTDGNVEGNLGVGFAIPTDTIFLVTERIANGLSLENGFLGISGQDPTLGRAGALVLNVVPDSPADQSGLQEGDLIIDVDGSTILGMSELAARIRLTSPGTTISLAVLRNGEEISLTVVLGTLGSFQ
jgi:putative serine protease PepD